MRSAHGTFERGMWRYATGLRIGGVTDNPDGTARRPGRAWSWFTGSPNIPRPARHARAMILTPTIMMIVVSTRLPRAQAGQFTA